jgi:hypothetical protein
MTDEQTDPIDDVSLEDFTPAEVYDYPDDVLEALVDVVNTGDFTLGLTVSLGGQTVTGDLCGGAEYFARAAELYEGIAGDNVVASGLAKALRERGQDYPIPEEQAARTSTVYFHMVDAAISGNSTPVFRGRLAAVDGWTFGRLG